MCFSKSLAQKLHIVPETDDINYIHSAKTSRVMRPISSQLDMLVFMYLTPDCYSTCDSVQNVKTLHCVESRVRLKSGLMSQSLVHEDESLQSLRLFKGLCNNLNWTWPRRKHTAQIADKLYSQSLSYVEKSQSCFFIRGAEAKSGSVSLAHLAFSWHLEPVAVNERFWPQLNLIDTRDVAGTVTF